MKAGILQNKTIECLKYAVNFVNLKLLQNPKNEYYLF